MDSGSALTSLCTKTAVALDCAIRVGVIAVIWLAIPEFWGEPEPNADGPPVGLLVVPLVAFLAWNVLMIGSAIRRWVDSALFSTSFLATVGALSALRLAWLLPVADEVVTGRRNLLMVLTVASAICAIVALLVAVGLNGGIYHPPDQHRVEEV